MNFIYQPAARNNNGQSIHLSLCMIVRDNERTLEPCLAGIKPWVDEMIVVDTGSTDRTPEIAQDFGARLSFFEWVDDFSAARNESLRRASGQWIFWMDSDDTIDEVNGRKLREVAYGNHHPSTLGYVMQVHCPGPDPSQTYEGTAVDHVKLFLNHPQIQFEGRIHEQVLMPIRRLGGEVGWTDIFVVHSGSDQTPEGRKRKIERDLRHLELDLKERPNHPFVLFNLGMTYDDIGKHEEAVQWLEKCLEHSEPHESHVRKVYALLANSHDQLGNSEEALDACRKGRQLYPTDIELQFRQANLLHKLGQIGQAEQAYRELLRNNPDGKQFASVDRGLEGYKARHNLGLLYLEMSRPDLAEVQFRMANAHAGGFQPSQQMLREISVGQGRVATAGMLP